MMRVSRVRGQTLTLVVLVVTALFLVLVNARRTSFKREQSQYKTRSAEDLVEWSGSRYSQCISSWEEIMALVPELGTVGNNLYSDGLTLSRLDAGTRKRLSDVAEVGGFHGVDSSMVLFYVGGNENAAVGRQMHAEYKFQKVFVYEPFPPFVQKLKRVFAGKGITVFDFGLSDEDKDLFVGDSGPATSTHSGAEGCKQGCQTVRIKDTLPVLAPLLRQTLPFDAILYTNCEGCEVPVLERLLEGGLIGRFKYIHIATHVDGTDHYVARLCRIREKLERTHKLVKEVPYAQERYVRKDA